ncbi:LysR family transcriptional regulator [Roseovarius aestuarii]|nr:LysR family transcriptional regulator [Roseovarius aestuarii]
MRRLDLQPKLVQSYLTVLRMQSYTKAAQALNLTQPAITQHVSRLESILSIPLIERSRSGLIPTQKAQAILPELERFERSAGLVVSKARAAAQSKQTILQIATPTSMVAHILAPTIAALKDADTEVFPVFKEVDDFRVYDMVRAGEVDFALTSMIGRHNDLSCSFLFMDHPCLVCPVDHPLAGEGSIEVPQIAPFPLIRPPAGTASNRMIEMFGHAYQIDFNFCAEAARLMTMAFMVRAGLGVLIVPALSAKLISDSALCIRPINTHLGSRKCMLIRPLHVEPTALVLQVLEQMQNVIADLIIRETDYVGGVET